MDSKALDTVADTMRIIVHNGHDAVFGARCCMDKMKGGIAHISGAKKNHGNTVILTSPHQLMVQRPVKYTAKRHSESRY